MQEIYVSMVTAGLFGLVIAGIHLVLFEVGSASDTPIEVASRLRFLILASLLFILVNIGAVFAFRATIPDDATFARDELETPFRINARRALLASGAVTLGLLFLTSIVVVIYWSAIGEGWDKYGLLLLAIPLTPMLIPSSLIMREERQVLRRDETYPDFIRALGGTAQARSSEPSATTALRGIDFGLLDSSIDRLEKRLSTRINSDRADYFNADTNSAVISQTRASTSKGRNPPANRLKPRKWCLGRSATCCRCATAALRPTPGRSHRFADASVTSLNVTIAIVLQLGEAVAGVASGITDNADVSALADFGAESRYRSWKIRLRLKRTFACSHHRVHPILGQVTAVSLIATRLRGGGLTSAPPAIQLLWVAGIASFITAVLLERASSARHRPSAAPSLGVHAPFFFDALLVAAQLQMGHVDRSCHRAGQCSRPKKMICRCDRSSFFGKTALRSRSVRSTLVPLESPQRAASRWMWVSTGNAGTPKAWAMTTPAVLCPTPGRSSNASKEAGTSPP